MWTLREQRLQGLGNGPSMGDIEVAPVPPQPAVAVAIDRDKSSQNALKWAVDNLVTRGQTIMLVHVANRSPTSSAPGLTEDQAKELFLPFRCFCTRKDQVRCKDIILEDSDVSKAIIDFIGQSAVEKLVMGYPSRNPFIRRFRGTDITTSVSKGAPDFCTVYVINKGKIASMRQAVRQAPAVLPFRPQVQQNSLRHEVGEEGSKLSPQVEAARPGQPPIEDNELIKSPFSRGMRGMAAKSYADLIIPETDASFVSSGRPSVDRLSASAYDHVDINPISRSSNASDGADQSFELVRAHLHGSMDVSMLGNGFSASSQDNGMASYSSPNIVSADQSGHWSYQNDVEAEMRRLRMELRQTMDLYSTACKEALTAKHMARQFQWWKMEEKQRLEEARLAEEAALAIAENEKAKCKAAMEAAEAAKRLAELEAQKRIDAEKKALKEKEEKQKALQALANNDLRCRKYTIQEIEAATDLFSEKRKIGEGGYGPVYKCYLDHTAVAIKVLRSDAAQGRSQFQQEVEVLSCIRHPNMVLLLGACPEYGYLVYEYMENGSLEDRLFRKDGTPALSWQLRFRIAAEIGTGLLFLHQTKPEPLVHRDLKPANILLDRNYVSKISDVGLARLVPPKVADDVTQYRMTSTAGTFCYIDPEYQQTGMLGIKSDVYSLGVILLQLITGRPPMGLTHYVSRAIEMGKFEEMLDPTVPDWTVEEALSFAKIALQCTELRRKDRPDLDTVVLPELNRLRALANESIHHSILGCTSPDNRSQTTISNVTMSAPATQCSYESLKSRSSVSYIKGTNIS